jgi:uncharacterized protein with ATP-grasp and redox domains
LPARSSTQRGQEAAIPSSTSTFCATKARANFETLSAAGANICFLLKIKCPVLATHTGLELGTKALIHRERGRCE